MKAVKEQKLKVSEVISLRDKLEKVKGLVGFEVNIAIKRNLQRIKSFLLPYQQTEDEMIKPIQKYLDEREALNKKHATVDGETKYKYEGKTALYDIQNEPEFKKEMAALKLKYKKEIDKYEAEHKIYLKKLAETDADFKITYVEEKHIPRDIITEKMELIFDIIKQ